MAGKTSKHTPPTLPGIPKQVKPTEIKAAGVQIPQWAIFAVLLVTALLYSKALANGLTDMDDDSYILKNPYLHNFSFNGVKAIFTTFYSSNYHPLTTLTYLCEYNWFGLNPLPYHLVNVALHVLNTYLAYVLAMRLGGQKITALTVSVLFALHPLHVESVAWVSERKDVLYAFFYFASLIYYLRYLASGYRKKDYLVTLLLFIASLLSKSAAVTLPLLLVAIDVYKGRAINTRAWIEKIPFFLLSILFGILNILAQKTGGPVLLLFSAYGFLNGFFLFTSGIAAYLIMLIAPFHLSAIHYFPVVPGGSLPWPYYLSLPLLLVIAWLAARRSAYRKDILFGMSFFLIAISVMLQIVSVGEAYMAERYSYVAYTGLFYIAGQWLSGLADKNKKTGMGIFFLFAIMFSALTWIRISVWNNSETLFTDIIDKNPGVQDVDLIYLLRANYRTHEGDLRGAYGDYTQAIDINPAFTFEYAAYYGRGHVCEMGGDVKSAINDYNKSISLNPAYPDVYNARGWDYFLSGDANAAISDLNNAISLNPAYAEAYNNRGWVYYKSGYAATALPDFDKAIQLAPGFDKPYFNRAMVKAAAGDLNGAIAEYGYLIKLNPGNNMPYYLRGMAQFNLKNTDAACADWKRANEMGNKDAAGMLKRYCH